MPIYTRWAEATTFHPLALPRYKDFRGNRALPGTGPEFKTLIRELKRIPFKPVDKKERRIIFVTSFNEWWEGTTIEPAREYGTSFLEAIRDSRD